MTQLTVFVEGVFDLFHANHMTFLSEVRAMGDRLIVGVTPDAHAAAYKRTPVLSLAERMAAVRASGLADLVLECPTMFGATITRDFIDDHGIGLVVYAGEGWEELYQVPIEMGIMRRVAYHQGINTSEIIKRIKARDDL